MMNFLLKAGKLFTKAKESLGNSENTIQAGLNFLGSINKLHFAMFLIPIASIFIVFLTITSAFSEEMWQAQMNDPNAGKSSASAGNVVYSEADFEDAIEVTHSAAIAGSVPEFASHLSGTDFGSLDGFNAKLKANVEKAGFGTVNGIIAAVMTLAYEYPKATGYKLFYNYPGTREKHDGVVDGLTYLDCRAFVFWALYNGGFEDDDLRYITGMPNMGTVTTDVRSVKPGDIFSTSGTGHIWLVVGTYDGGYYAAEEFGYGNGLVINKYSYENAYSDYPSASLYDMSGFYNNPANVRAR